MGRFQQRFQGLRRTKQTRQNLRIPALGKTNQAGHELVAYGVARSGRAAVRITR
jgi:hypothetical protein